MKYNSWDSSDLISSINSFPVCVEVLAEARNMLPKRRRRQQRVGLGKLSIVMVFIVKSVFLSFLLCFRSELLLDEALVSLRLLFYSGSRRETDPFRFDEIIRSIKQSTRLLL